MPVLVSGAACSSHCSGVLGKGPLSAADKLSYNHGCEDAFSPNPTFGDHHTGCLAHCPTLYTVRARESHHGCAQLSAGHSSCLGTVGTALCNSHVNPGGVVFQFFLSAADRHTHHSRHAKLDRAFRIP